MMMNPEYQYIENLNIFVLGYVQTCCYTFTQNCKGKINVIKHLLTRLPTDYTDQP